MQSRIVIECDTTDELEQKVAAIVPLLRPACNEWVSMREDIRKFEDGSMAVNMYIVIHCDDAVATTALLTLYDIEV